MSTYITYFASQGAPALPPGEHPQTLDFGPVLAPQATEAAVAQALFLLGERADKLGPLVSQLENEPEILSGIEVVRLCCPA